jgi:hypothetical protein
LAFSAALASSARRAASAALACSAAFFFAAFACSAARASSAALAFFGCDQLGALSPREIRIGTVRVKVEKHVPGIDRCAALKQFVVASRLGVEINGRGNERDSSAAERTVDERLLLVRSRFQDVVTDLAERDPQVEAGVAR